MPITTNLDTFTTNSHKRNGATECHVCYDIIKEGKGVKCCNGHEICEEKRFGNIIIMSMDIELLLLAVELDACNFVQIGNNI